MQLDRHSILYLIVFSVFVYIMQSMIVLCWDVSSLLYDAKLFLEGGTYVSHFFETNPPMIFLIYLPVVLFSKLSGLPASAIMRIYTILLALLSIICCETCLKCILNKQDDKLRYILFFILAFVFLLLPNSDFSQREHFLIIFMMPYIFSAVLAAQGKSIHPGLAVLIGIMAGLGFGLKPFFLPALLFIELYLIFIKRSIISCLRIEVLICVGILFVYLGYIFVFHPNYIDIMLPLLFNFYFPAIKQPWIALLTKSFTIFCFILLGYYLAFYNKKYYRELSAILMLAFCGMILAFVIPRTLWWSHILPAVSFSCLLIAIFIYQIFYEKIHNGLLSNTEIFFLILAGLIVPLNLCVERIGLIVKYNKFFNTNLLIQSLRHTNPKSVYCFANITICFPLLQDTDHEFGGRFPLFWWVNGLLQMEKSNALTETILQQKNFLMNIVVDDLNDYRPQIVIVNPFKMINSLNILEYFLQNEKFQTAWKQYRYVDTFGPFVVYERINSVHLS